ncbi:MarR family winged helix-turn-helix transcriptional regulator [Inquilinus sp. CA228]|uniref:MarR family winged helix-turn-helix transcriptional regulator n=1 Tax=Inquilinus sp. CA228 TaxID=3455609 RepID=UPI003F8D2CEC
MPDAAPLSPPAQIRLGWLDGAVAYHLRLAQAASFQAFAELAGETGLRPGRYAVLQLIHDNPGVGQTALSRAAGRDKTTLTPMLNDLERRGLITRTPHPTDRRGRMLRLTEAGEVARARLADCAKRHDARLDALLGAKDKAELIRMLRLITTALDRDPTQED